MHRFLLQTRPSIIGGRYTRSLPFYLVVPCLIALCVSSVPLRVFAQGGSPLKTHSTGTPPQGTWITKLMFSFDDAGSKHVFTAPNLDLKYGLLDNVELAVKVPWMIITQDGHTKSGVGNSAVSVKWRWFNDPETYRAFALEPLFEFNNPTHSVQRGIVSKGWKLRMPLMGSMHVGVLKIGAEVGYQITQHGPDAWMSGIVVGYALHPTIDLAIEVHDQASNGWTVRDPVIGIGSRFRLPSHLKVLVGFERHVGGALAHGRGAIASVGVEMAR